MHDSKTEPLKVAVREAYEKLRSEQLFAGKLGSAVERAERCGVRSSVIVSTVGDAWRDKPSIFEHEADTLMHPASTIKTAVAVYLAASKLADMSEAELSDPHGVDWSDFADEDFVAGGGRFDQLDAPRHASYLELIADMMDDERSGNMAQKLLVGRNGTEDFNAFWAEQGVNSVRLRPTGDWFEIEAASARDILRVMSHIPSLNSSDANQTVVTAVVTAMEGGSGRIGTVSGALDEESRSVLLTKSGKLPPDDQDPYDSRHDSGVINGHNGKSFAYVILTQAESKPGLVAAIQMIDQIGARIGQEAGLSTAGRIRRAMGNRGLQLAASLKR